MSKFNIQKTEAQTRIKINKHKFFNSDLMFLNDHNGFRKGKLHLLLGSTGSGKSTIIRTVLTDLITKNPKKNILLYLSEETTGDLKDELALTDTDFSKNENLFVISEQEINQKVPLQVYLKDAVDQYKIDLILFDNITTSIFYGEINYQEQAAVSKWFKTYAQEKNIPIVLIAHTMTGTNMNLRQWISEDQIRGSKYIANLVEFLYILQRVQVDDTSYQLIRTVKHRSQSPAHKVYELIYSREKRLYLGAIPISAQKIKEIFSGKRPDSYQR